MRITLPAFAKINLTLRVGEKRADGFHEVRTVLQTISAADRIRCETHRGEFVLRCSDPAIPADRTNLVWKAAQSLWLAAGREGHPRDARVTLEKRIPTRAGLGGGSSDAAAALFGLRRVWRLKISDPSLQEIGAAIGADVAYFFVGGTALALGRGEQVYALDDLPRLPVVLIFPPFGISTADAYQWLDDWRDTRGAEHSPPDDVVLRALGRKGSGILSIAANDFEPPVIARHPVIEQLKARLMKAGASLAAMSGSGSTVFGVFPTIHTAKKAAAGLARSGAHVRLVRFQPRAAR